jgi:hypothetical protein
VYSTRFIAGITDTGSAQSFTAPPGFTTVVRDITACQVGTGADNLIEWVLAVAGVDTYQVAYMSTTGSGTSAHLELRLVLNAGDVLVAAAEGAPLCTVTASGYLLSLP